MVESHTAILKAGWETAFVTLTSAPRCSFHIALLVFFTECVAFVVSLLSLSDTDFAFGPAVVEVDRQGHEG